ncbi:hypothetical protein D3C81_2175210 [compost metagenome]
MSVQHRPAISPADNTVLLQLLQIPADRFFRHLEHAAQVGDKHPLILMDKIYYFIASFGSQHRNHLSGAI